MAVARGDCLKPDGKITIYDVAREAGCSTATVSLVMKGDSRVNAKTAERVLKCAEELNYRPNYLASSLASKKTNTIGVIVSNLNNPVFSEIICGIEEFISKCGYSLTIGVTYFSVERERHYLDLFSRNRTDGIVLLPTRWAESRAMVLELQKQGFPMCVSGINPNEQNISFVASNMSDGAFLSVEYLIKMGHRNIAFVAGDSTLEGRTERFEGYQRALKLYGIDFNPEYVIKSEVDFASIRNAMLPFMKKHPDVTALYCMYDYIALAVIKAMSDLNLRVPEDISIVGYDNIDISEYYPVGLTTVEPGNKKIGELSGRIIVNMIEKSGDQTQSMLLTPKLITRNSVMRRDVEGLD